MKEYILELNDKEPIRLVECTNHYINNNSIVEDIKLKTDIITDGKIINYGENKIEEISCFYLDGEKYDSVDTLKTKNVYINNFNYVIKILSNKENIKKVTIYLKDLNDKNILHEVRKVLFNLEKNKLNNTNEISNKTYRMKK